MGIQHKTSSVQSKTHVGDSKYGVVMIPFSDCLWDDTCLPNFRFSTKWAHSARFVTTIGEFMKHEPINKQSILCLDFFIFICNHACLVSITNLEFKTRECNSENIWNHLHLFHLQNEIYNLCELVSLNASSYLEDEIANKLFLLRSFFVVDPTNSKASQF
jgi:hypothetical protein